MLSSVVCESSISIVVSHVLNERIIESYAALSLGILFTSCSADNAITPDSAVQHMTMVGNEVLSSYLYTVFVHNFVFLPSL